MLVSRFRSSHHCAAHSFANFGIKGTLEIYDSSAVFGFEVPTQTRGHNDRNFKSTALWPGSGTSNPPHEGASTPGVGGVPVHRTLGRRPGWPEIGKLRLQ